MSSTLQAGVARRLVNPGLGQEKVGLRLFGEPIDTIESDLTATVLVAAGGGRKVAIAAVDLCLIPAPVVAEVRARVAEAVGTDSSHVMLNMSHTHSAPAFPGWMEITEDRRGIKRQYQERFIETVAEAAAAADRSLTGARLAAGRGESRIGVYRRETGPDGRDLLGEVPGAPIDPAVGVVRLDDVAGRPLAVQFSYGCHPVVVGPRSTVASSDYPGAARALLERELGGTALFLQACGGNINPAVGIGFEVDCRETKERVGRELGAEALKVACGLRTHVRPGARVPLGDIPNILFTPWQPVAPNGACPVGAAEERVPLGFTELPTLDEARRIRARWQETLAERLARPAQDWEIRVAAKFAEWSGKLVEAVEDGDPRIDLVIQAIRIGDAAFVGLNVEAFFETGLAIKARSPFPHTQVLGYTNGSLGYLPRAEDYPPGGWKLGESYAVPDLFVQSYSLPVALRPESEQLAVERAVALLERLRAAGGE
jgi:hypothetical protein